MQSNVPENKILVSSSWGLVWSCPIVIDTSDQELMPNFPAKTDTQIFEEDILIRFLILALSLSSQVAFAKPLNPWSPSYFFGLLENQERSHWL